MKVFSTLVSAVALASALGFAGPVAAQDRTIGDIVVPADQIEAVQARCDELREASVESTGTTASGETNEPTSNTSGTAGNSTDNAAGGTLADSKDASTTANAPGSDSGTQGQDSNSADTNANSAAANTSNMGNASGTAGALDLATITIEQCDEGGFVVVAQ